MSERAFVHRIVTRLRKAGYFVQRIEDSVSAGIPDIFIAHESGLAAWIEVKWVADWPKRASTPLRTTLTEHQALWLTDCPCETWLAIKVRRDELWIRGHHAWDVLRGLTRDQLLRIASSWPFDASS